MKKLGLVALLLSFVMLSSCSCTKLSCIEGNQDIVTKERLLGEYVRVVTEGSFDVECIKDTGYAIVITGESNILEYISTSIEDGVLKIKPLSNVCLSTNSRIFVKCYAPAISGVKLTGSGDVLFDTLQSEQIDLSIVGSGDMRGNVYASNLSVKIIGSGDFKLKGEATNSRLKIMGSGNIDANACKQRNSEVEISGSGDVYVNASDKLDVWISGSGDVHYIGYPELSVDISGSGKVIDEN